MRTHYSARLILLVKLCLGFALLLSHTSAQALDYDVDVFVDANADTDGRKDGSSLAELETALGLGFSVNHDGRQIDYTGNYRAQYADYVKDTNTQRSSFDGSSELVAELLPQRLNWLASHTVADISPSRRDAADIADDRQQRHQFSTGPFISYPITAVDKLTLAATYSEQLFDSAENAVLNSNDADSQSISANVNWVHSLSPITQLLGGYQYQQFERDGENVKTDFQRVYVGYTRSLRTLQYAINLGSNSSKREGQSSNDSFFLQGDISKSFGSQTLSASASRQQTESSLGINPLRFSADLSTPDTSALNLGQTLDNAAIAGVVQITYLSADYNSTTGCKLCNYGLEASITDSNYASAPSLDDRATEARAFYAYRISQHITAELSSRYSFTEFLSLNQEDRGNSSALSLRWHATPRLRITAVAGYEEEEAESGDNFYSGFGSLGFSYNLASSRKQTN
ncbi:MAG: hypothetical protein HKO71_01050 [Pseudomonadales bacterium]|nr:hypothetical protein [Gammaproteobacteria bacterium]NNL56313.1 hypothetical protein [Pseudomonadales bacterium]